MLLMRDSGLYSGYAMLSSKGQKNWLSSVPATGLYFIWQAHREERWKAGSEKDWPSCVVTVVDTCVDTVCQPGRAQSCRCQLLNP